jgi:thiol-disulfide isomerase/thioredoxin
MFTKDEFADVQSNMMGLLTNQKFIILCIVIFLIFLGISIYIYYNYIHPKIFNNYTPNSEFINPEYDNKILIMWFYTEWCPHCKSTKPEWDKFKDDVNNKSFDIPINFKEIDCDIYTDVADQYNIDGYPTIKLLYKTEVYDYDATPDRYRLMEFLKGSLPSNPFSEKALEKDVKEVEKDVWTVIQ